MNSSELTCNLLRAGLVIGNDTIYDRYGSEVGRFVGNTITDSSGMSVDVRDVSTFYPGMGAVELVAKDYTRYVIKCGNEYAITEEIKYDMPSDLISTVASMRHLYPDLEKKLFFEQVSLKEMIDMSLIGEPEKGIVPLDDKTVVRFLADYQDRLKMMGYMGRKAPGKEVLNDAIDFFTSPVGDNARNMFMEWVKSHEWDGNPRVRTWFKRTLGVTAPALKDFEGAEDIYIGDATQAWFVGAIARQFAPIKHEVVPVFIGKQGINKGNVLRFTSGMDKWFKDTQDPIDNIKVFTEGIGGRIVVELGEAVQLSGRNSEIAASKMKAFISATEDQLRLPYARRSTVIPRRFVLAATSNEDSVFHDTTGNRRFFPMYCDSSKVTFKLDILDGKGGDWKVDRSIGQYEVEQLWAEAYQMYLNGAKTFIAGESKELAEVMQDYGTVTDPDVAAIKEFLDDPLNGFCAQGVRITPSMLYELVFGVKGYVPVDIKNAVKRWSNEAVLQDWSRLPSSALVNGKRCSIAYERKTTGQGAVNRYPILKRFKRILPDDPDPVQPFSVTPTIRSLDFDMSSPAVPIASKKMFDALETLMDAGVIPRQNYVYSPRSIGNGTEDIEDVANNSIIGDEDASRVQEVVDISEPEPVAPKPVEPRIREEYVKEKPVRTPEDGILYPDKDVDGSEAVLPNEVRLNQTYSGMSVPNIPDIPDVSVNIGSGAGMGTITDVGTRGSTDADTITIGGVQYPNLPPEFKGDDFDVQWERDPDTPLIMQVCDYVDRLRMAYNVPDGAPLRVPVSKVPDILCQVMESRGIAYVEGDTIIIEDVL